MSKLKRMSLGSKVIFAFLLIWAAIQIFPIYWMFTFSLKDNNEIFGKNMLGLPQKWLWSNYTAAMNVGNIGQYFLNSFIVTGCTILVTVVFSLMATYALKRMVFRGRKLLYNLIMLGLTVPIHAAILPVFLILNRLKMTNSYQALILPYAAFALSMSILIAASFMEGMPKELEEAACIDGCNVYQIFFHIVLPFMSPCISTVSIFVFLQAWNELMFAVVFISDSKFRTLPVGIQTLCGAYTTDWGPIGAALVIATFPTLIMYCFMSEKIQESMAAGAVKG